MTTIALTHSITTEAVLTEPMPARSLGPFGILAAFAAVPVGTAAIVASIAPVAALVVAFALVVASAVAIALKTLDMADDVGDPE